MSIGSLLGKGVMFWPFALAKVDFFDEADGSFALPLLVVDSPLAFGTTVGLACEAVGAAFEKNPRMDCWFLLDAALEFCFLSDGGGRAGVSAIAPSVFAMLVDYFKIKRVISEVCKWYNGMDSYHNLLVGE